VLTEQGHELLANFLSGEAAGAPLTVSDQAAEAAPEATTGTGGATVDTAEEAAGAAEPGGAG
jgi:hypothetical protein